MFNLIGQLYGLLETRERWQLLALTLCMLMMALLETVGVASILPFMQVVSNPGLIESNHWLAMTYDRLGFDSTRSFLFFLGIVVLVVITINNSFSALTTWLMNRFAWGQNHRLSTRLLVRYLERPYEYYLTRNTSGMSRNILSEVQTVVQGVMLASLKFFCRFLIAILMVGLLAAVDIRLAVLVGTVLGGAYGGVYMMLKRKQRRLGKERILQNGRRYQIAGETFAGIKELKVLGRERGFLRRFREPSWLFSKTSASNHVVATLPRYALETIAFSGILFIVLYSLRFSDDIAQMLPILTLYVFAGYRLMPSLNDMFAAAMQIRFNRAALEILHADLKGPVAGQERLPTPETQEQIKLKPLPLQSEIAVRKLSYQYPGAAVASLESIDMLIKRQQIVGLVGETGAGKTTLVDVILGLLEPTSGTVEIDGKPLSGESRLEWRRSCGYIPQDIFLSDDTVRANIAFGVPPNIVDDNAVVRAARIAQIDDFILTLPEKYETKVGERGIRLSGGQRQRIGIARAMYHDPDVLVMDEATSSLDGATEAAVMEMIHSLGRMKTLIVIAHRLSTVRECDVIYLIQNGKVTASGKYDDLTRTNTYFRSMAGLQGTAQESAR